MNKNWLTYVRPGALVVALAAVTVQCSENVSPRTPSAIAMAAGNGQTAGVGEALDNPLIVVVTDNSGDPVEGVTVAWDAEGVGSVSSASSSTGADGHAAINRTLGSQTGEQTTTATVNGLSGSPVTFVSIATDGTTPSLSMVTQPSSTAQSGVAFAAQPVVQLKAPDGSDKHQAGVAVTASLASGSGTLDGTVTEQTNGNGTASFVDLSITGSAGSYTLRFAAAGVIPAISSGITISGGSNSILLTTNPPSTALDGEVFDPSVQPVVQVKDNGGNPAAGVAVTASVSAGPGTLEGTTTATTDAQGLARFGDLGISGPGNTTLAFGTGSLSVTAAPVNVTALPSEATTGKWGPLVPWPIVPLHMHLLPTGKVLGWGKYEDGGVAGTHGSIPRLWDPASGQFTAIQADTMLFCSGHTFLADGRLLVAGGHKADDTGIDATNIFDPTSQTWSVAPKMAFGRWYPTVTILDDGRLLTMAGRDSASKVVTTPELWQNGQWVQLTGAGTINIPYYPRNFVDPKIPGRVFMAGERITSRWFDVNSSTSGKPGRWTTGPSHIWKFNRDYGTAAMYDTGKILYAGGGGNSTWAQAPQDAKSGTPTNTAERIDLNAASPQWASAGTMAFPRRHLNSTVLPDGTVLITGGTTGGGFADINPAHAAKAAELWDPKTNQWTTLASNSVMRIYHSVSLLLPDGTVLHGASGNALSGNSVVPDEPNHEIFQPPYLFKGARPTITAVPATVGYGQVFSVATPNAAQVTDVRWIRLGSVTHAFDQSARANTLGFTRTATGVDVTAPASGNLAPPGYYLLFILNRNGVPSAGKIVRIG